MKSIDDLTRAPPGGRMNPKDMAMKRALIGLVVASLTIANALAGGEAIIKQRAKDLSNQNNVRQGVPPPVSSPGTVAPPVASHSAVSKFQTDLAAVKVGEVVPESQKQLIAADLLAMAQGAKPSVSLARKLADKLTAACAEKQLSASSRARLAQDLDAMLNPGRYPQAKPEGIFTDVQAIFQDNSLSRKEAYGIAEDVKAMAQEIQNGGAK